MSTPKNPQQALQDAITYLQSHRAALGNALVDAALAPLLERVAALNPQAAPLGPARRLRQVSALFLDLVGSTQLIQRLDPEEVQTEVDGAQAAFSAIVQQHGGEMLRYAGTASRRSSARTAPPAPEKTTPSVRSTVAWPCWPRQRGAVMTSNPGMASRASAPAWASTLAAWRAAAG